MAQGDLFLCTYRYNVGAQPVTITLGFEHTGGVGDIEFELCSIVSLKVAGEMTSLANYLSVQCTFESAKTRKLTGLAQPPGISHSAATAGQVNFASIPQSKSLMVVHRQTSAGVRSNGKSYIAGIPENITNGNTINSAPTLTGIRDIFDDLLTWSGNVPGGSADFRMVVLSKTQGAQGQVVGLPVVENRVNSTLYNSRRRQTREFGYAADASI